MLLRLISFFILILFSVVSISCSEHELCGLECENRFDNCNDDCDKNNPAGSEELNICIDHCDYNFIKCKEKCAGIDTD